MRKKTIVTLIIIVAYVILKLYVLNTPTTADDGIPDIILHLVQSQPA